MKMLQPKKQMTNLLLVACLLTSAVGVATITGVATDEQPAPAPTVTYETLAMEDGASVRIASKKDEAGIRFRLKMSKSEYEAITAQNSPYTDVSFGVLVAPEDYLTAGHELTEANVFGANAIYGWATRNDDGTWNEYTDTGKKVEIVNFETTTMTWKDGEYCFDGSLVDIMDGTETPTNNVSREFRGVGYMRYTDNGTEKYVMVGDDDNVRSIAYVAQKAIEAGKITDATDVENITKFYITDVQSKATVKYYKYGENGYEVADTVQSDDIQIGDIFKAEKKSYDGYMFDNANSALSGKVYANGKTTLNVYYNPMDNLAPTVGSWMLLQNGIKKADNNNQRPQYDYVPTVSELTFAVDGSVNNLGTPTARYKLVGENQTELTYKDSNNVEKEVAQSYESYLNYCHNVLVGANLSSLTKADLIALADKGYLKLTFSFVYNTVNTRYPNYYVLDLAKVKADSTLKIRDANGFINWDVLKIATGADITSNDNNMLNKRWITVTYSMADLIACYDQLFKGETYWTLAVPYGDVLVEGGSFYMSKLGFERTVNDLSNVLPTANDWGVRLGGYRLESRMGLDYTAEETIESVAWSTSNKGFKVVKQSGSTSDHGVHFTRQVALPGKEEVNLTYKNKEVGFSFPLLPNDKDLPIFIGAGLSHVTKADLQTILELGYTKLSFSFVHNATFEGLAQSWGYYLLDLETVKNNPDMKLRADYIEGDVTYTNRVNVNAFKKVAMGKVGGIDYQNNDNKKTREWVDVEYAVADLIACYDQLFAGEAYWTLAMPYGSIGHYNNGLTETGGEIGRTYVTKLAFTK